MFKHINNKNILKPCLFIVLTLVLTAVAIAIRTIDLSFFFDNDIGYYQRDSIFPVITNILLVASVLFFAIASIFLTRIPESFNSRENTPLTIIGSALCALTFLVMVVNFFLFYMEYPIKIIAIYALLALFSSLYFISNIVNFAGQYRALLVIPVIVDLTFILATSYFKITIQMNSPMKILLHITCLALMFFFISEARSFFEDIKKKRYLFWLCTAILFSGTYSISSMIYFVTSDIFDYNFASYVIIFFAMFVYLVIRAITVIIATKKSVAENIVNEDQPKSQEEEDI